MCRRKELFAVAGINAHWQKGAFQGTRAVMRVRYQPRIIRLLMRYWIYVEKTRWAPEESGAQLSCSKLVYPRFSRS